MPRADKKVQQGLKRRQSGDREQAERLYKEALARDPDNVDALHLLGLLARESGDHQAEYNLIRRAVEIKPAAAPLHNNLGAALESLERLDEAIRSYEQALHLQPDFAEAELNLGNALLRQGKIEEAVTHYQHAIRERPGMAEARNSLGVALRALGRMEEAAGSYREAIRLNADYADPYINLGALQFAQQDAAGAERSFREALRLRPELTHIRGALAAALIRQGRFAEAEPLCRENLQFLPEHSETLNHLGVCLQMQERRREAVETYRRALRASPEYAEAYQNLGTCLILENRLEEAAECCRAALRIQPHYPEAHNTLGHALARMGRFEDALSEYRQAIALRPGYAEALNNTAAAQLELGRLSQAAEACRMAVASDPKLHRAYTNLGTALYQQGYVEEAVAALRQTLARRPDDAAAHSNLLFCLNYDAAWTPEAVLAEHQRWAAVHSPVRPRPARPRRPVRRIGYVSPDFREHPVGFFAEPALRAHDRGAFEIHLFSNVSRPDAATARFQTLGQWHDICGLPDREAADLVRRERIDVLVDLAGHSAGNRLPVFAERPAPLQITWCGYPNTTGMPAMDYRLTDAWADPPGLTERLHTEKLARLPGGFLCYVPPAGAPEVGPSPARETGRVTFGSFNALPKIRAATVAAWAEILSRTPGSRLILKSKGLNDPAARRRLIDLFAAYGIGEPQIELAVTVPSHAHHLDLYNRVDIALDTFPYHGTTTTCEALWMGVPVVTLAGATHVSRVGVSLLERTGLGDLVAYSPSVYAARACALAADLDHLAALRAGLRERVAASPLGDAVRFTRELEDLYRRLWEDDDADS